MKINLYNEITTIEDGTYKAKIITASGYDNDTKILLRFAIQQDDSNDEEPIILVKFETPEKLGSHIWRNVFKALETDELEDLVGNDVEIEVKNTASKKTDKVFCNIVKVRLIEK